jgi:putative transposase
MGRISRRNLVDVKSTHHCMFRSHNLMKVFDDKRVANKFLALLSKYKVKYGILLHSYCLMSTHPHVTLSVTRGQESFSGFWRDVNCQLAKFVNELQERKGQVVMERLRSPRIQADGKHLLTVMRYGDLNPVKAKLVKCAKDWKYSSHRHYAYGEKNELIDDAPDYVALAKSPSKRRLAYLHLFAKKLAESLMTKRPDLTMFYAVGDAQWVEALMEKWGFVRKKPLRPTQDIG